MVMELLEPNSARSRMIKGGYPWQVATRIIADCCAALTMAHAAGIVHRDIKPDNILFTTTGVVKLVDFGLVKLLEDDMNLTQSGMLCGTPLYMSPEQASNEEMDTRSDLYSLGVTYFALLTGRPPFIGPGVPQILLSHLASPTPDPRTLVQSIPEPCVRIVLRAHGKRSLRPLPEPRPRWKPDLEAALQGVPHRNSSVFTMEKSLDSPSGMTSGAKLQEPHRRGVAQPDGGHWPGQPGRPCGFITARAARPRQSGRHRNWRRRVVSAELPASAERAADESGDAGRSEQR